MENSLAFCIKTAEEHGISLSGVARMCQMEDTGATDDEITEKMRGMLSVMAQSVEKGMDGKLRSVSGLTGGGAPMLFSAAQAKKTAGGMLLGCAEARALAVAELNAAMGKIVAAPTAGACGILPGALLTAKEEYDLSDDALIDALLVAALVGQVIAARASISGAKGGCQAECGSASAMAAAALVFLRGGSARQSADAAGFALMNIMGLVCDPVRGLVEVPCVYRNVMGVANALSAADLALSGIVCPLPPDEVIDQMRAVGDMMPPALRETGDGGCAACPSACAAR